MWLLISLDSCLCCEDVIKSKLVYTVLMRPKIWPKHVSAVKQRDMNNHLVMTQLAAGFAAKGLLNLMRVVPLPQVCSIKTHHLILSNIHSESDAQSYIFTRVA